MENKNTQEVKNFNSGERVTETQEGRIICSVEVMEWIDELKSEVMRLDKNLRTVTEVLRNEVNRNQEGFEKVSNLLGDK